MMSKNDKSSSNNHSGNRDSSEKGYQPKPSDQTAGYQPPRGEDNTSGQGTPPQKP